MNWGRRWRRRDQLDRELDRELRDHLERQIADYVAGGMPPGAARRRARLEFGGLDQIKETCRDARGLRLFEETGADLGYALRSFRTSPGFMLVAVLTLALGIGANTAVFSLVNALIFRPPAVRDPAALVFVNNCTGSESVIAELAARRDIFMAAAGWMPTQFSVAIGGESGWLDGVWATSSYLDTLGIDVVAGGRLRVARHGEAAAIMISHALWERRFNRAHEAIGQRITVNHVPFTIAGVMPPGFTGLDVGRTFDVLVPYAAYALVTGRRAEGCGPLNVVARLVRGRSPADAESALAAAQPHIRHRLMPEARLAGGQQRFLSRPFAVVPAYGGNSDIRPRYERPLFTILTVAALVLLMACATLANLLLARAARRRHEISVRLALGASRRRLLRQLLIESALVAAIGAAAGLAIAWWGSRAIVSALASESVLAIGRIVFGSAHLFLDVSLDWRVLAFTAAVAIATVIVFGLAPAAATVRIGPALSLSDRIRRNGDGGTAIAKGLVVAQVALSLVLLVAAGLFLRSQASLRAVPVGFEPDRMLVVDITTSPTAAHAAHLPVYERARAAVRRVPGVAEATLSISAPMTGWDLLVEVTTTTGGGRAESGGDSLANIVTPGWFHTLGTPLVAGRDFDQHDRRDAEAVVVVNEAFVRQFLRTTAPLGRTIAIEGMGTETRARRIVGVAADALWSLRDPVPPILYIPLAQADEAALELRLQEEGLTLGVRAGDADPASLKRAIAAAFAALDPTLMLTFRSPSEHIEASLTQERLLARLSTFFGALALVLASAGLYGVTAYAVSCRRTEMALRLALGSAPARVLGAAVLQVAGLVGAGVAAGLAASALLAPFASALLYGIEARDALTLASSAALLTLVTAAAVWAAARRALRLDVATVLRSG